ncbi:MAG TPA: Fic family protein [Labilithrix sp.]|jgi:Fic family protein
MAYRPPYELTLAALKSHGEIMQLVGRYEGAYGAVPPPMLVRKNRIRTIAGTLAIEGNPLDEEQITAILDEKRVMGSKRDVLEVKNAIAVYADAASFDPGREPDLLRAHGALVRGLARDAGRFRSGAVGVMRGARVAHVAPPPREVPRLVRRLLEYVRCADADALVTSAVVHYELEFIHPFSDGNGRIGRFWQHLVLCRFHPIFSAIPVESVVSARRRDYYRVLGECDRAGSSTAFVEHSLAVIRDALASLLAEAVSHRPTGVARLDLARATLGTRVFSRKDWRALFPMISTATASRDLREGVDQGVLVRRGTKALAEYRYRRSR